MKPWFNFFAANGVVRVTSGEGHWAGALHSRSIESGMIAAKTEKVSCFFMEFLSQAGLLH